MTLVIIPDLTNLSDWDDFPLIWKHKYYLPAGCNLVFVCNLTDAIGSVEFNGVKLVVIDVAWTL